MNARAVGSVVMPIFIGVAILVIASAIINSSSLEIVSFDSDTLVYGVGFMVSDCSKDMGLTQINEGLFEGYYQSANVEPIEEPWNGYSRSYNHCYLNGYEGLPQVNQYGMPWCSFSEIPYNDDEVSNCRGDLTFSVLPIVNPPNPPNPDGDGSIWSSFWEDICDLIAYILGFFGVSDTSLPYASYVDRGGSTVQASWDFDYNDGDAYMTVFETGQVVGGNGVQPISLKFYMRSGTRPTAPFSDSVSCPYQYSSASGCWYNPFNNYGIHTQGFDFSGLQVEINDVPIEINDVHVDGDGKVWFIPTVAYSDRDKIKVSGRIYINRLAGTPPDPDPDSDKVICCKSVSYLSGGVESEPMYGYMAASKCVVPDGYTGMYSEVVDDSFCGGGYPNVFERVVMGFIDDIMGLMISILQVMGWIE